MCFHEIGEWRLAATITPFIAMNHGIQTKKKKRTMTVNVSKVKGNASNTDSDNK